MLFIQFLIQEGIIMQNSIQIKGGMPLYGEVIPITLKMEAGK